MDCSLLVKSASLALAHIDPVTVECIHATFRRPSFTVNLLLSPSAFNYICNIENLRAEFLRSRYTEDRKPLYLSKKCYITYHTKYAHSSRLLWFIVYTISIRVASLAWRQPVPVKQPRKLWVTEPWTRQKETAKRLSHFIGDNCYVETLKWLFITSNEFSYSLNKFLLMHVTRSTQRTHWFY